MPCHPEKKPCGCPEWYACKCRRNSPQFPDPIPERPPRVVAFGQLPIQVPDDGPTRKALALNRRFDIAKLQAESCGIRARAGGPLASAWLIQMETWLGVMQKLSADLEDLGL